LLTSLVDQAMAADEIDPQLDSGALAAELLALVDGMGVDALMHPKRLTASRQRAILREHLARLAPDKSAD
jgi:hypothetical protein